MSNSQVRNARYRVRAAVAAALSASIGAASMTAIAAEETPAAEEAELEEVRVTGSRIVRRDLQSNSPLVTIERQQIDDSTFVSVEEALNDLPQFMVGGAGMSSAAVTGLQAANGLDGGRGSGDMFNSALLPDNAGMIGIVVPGAANVNLRGLGANRSLTLIDGHRGMPVNASMTVDLNTIPSSAIGGIEVITGGASAVYGADALAGVTNIRLREDFEGLSMRVRGGVNEVGDGGEYQVSALMGTRLAGQGNAMLGIEYTRRNPSYWDNRDFFLEAMESPYSGSGTYLFSWEPFYSPGAATGTYNSLQRAWSGNAPTLGAVNGVFSDRNCPDAANPGQQLNCVATGANNAAAAALASPFVGPALFAGYHFNTDGSLFVRGSQTGTGAGTLYWGPQGYNSGGVGDRVDPNKIACTFTAVGTAAPGTDFAGEPCAPSAGNRIDYGRWLSGRREAYNLFGSANYNLNDKVEAFSSLIFSSSNSETRREPSPAQGGFGAVIPFGQNQVYLPSLIQVPAPGQTIGATRPEYLAGGTRGTSCAPTGGCTMAQAFPVPTELRTLLESRAGTATITGTTSPFRGLNACQDYQLVPLGTTNPLAQTNTNANYPGTTTNIRYTVSMDPNTGLPQTKCGMTSGWQFNQQLTFLPVRGTTNTGRLFQFAGGLRGDLGLSDWTWEAYTSYGDSETQTNYNGFASLVNYMKIISAPNFGRGYNEVGVSSKYFTCASGLNPFDPNLVISADCLDAVQSNQVDRNSMTQRIYEVSTQGHAFEMPAGEARAALGATYRKNAYRFTPDSLRERDYTLDANPGAFASGSIDESVSVKEVYGELLIPVLKDLPFIRSFELELGARSSKYSMGQTVDTYKILGSWEPVDWLRARGGYNRAERAPNMSELYATPSGSAQFAAFPTDPCRANATLGVTFGGNQNYNHPDNPNRAQLQALCSDHINAWGGNNATDYHTDPNTWDVLGGSALIVGNPDLRNERGDTWTVGLAFTSPLGHPLLSRVNGTLDWYEARVTDPIEVQQTSTIVNGCYNVDGTNSGYDLNDANGFCSLIERDPSTGAITRVYNSFGNQGKLVIRGMDLSLRWSAALADMGVGEAPGTLSLNLNGNYLIDQIQRYGAAFTDDYAGYGGASRIRTNTAVSYAWGRGSRVSLTWQYRHGTHTPTTYAVTPATNGTTGPDLTRNALMAGYGTTNLFSLTGGTRIGEVNASLSINNLLDAKPKPGGYDLRDPRAGFGTFSPFDDLVGRRYSINMSMDF